MKYRRIIGLEIHAQILSKFKMFSNSEYAVPGKHFNAIDLGYPGTLPLLNEEVVKKTIILANELHMSIDPMLRFDRKHYFYYDLPKGFQITQFFHPIAINGDIPFLKNKNAIRNIQIEEDSAKTLKIDNSIYLDPSRVGVPLIEIITNPTFSEINEIINCLKIIRYLLLFHKISDGKLENGSMRCDVNISYFDELEHKSYPRIEIKNLNSYENIKTAVNTESSFYLKQIKEGIKFDSVTKFFNEKQQKCDISRKKLSENEYFFLPETNLPIFDISYLIADNNIAQQNSFQKFHSFLLSELNEQKISAVYDDIDKLDLFKKLLKNSTLNPNLVFNFVEQYLLFQLKMQNLSWKNVIPLVPKYYNILLKITKENLSLNILKPYRQELVKLNLSIDKFFSINQANVDINKITDEFISFIKIDPKAIAVINRLKNNEPKLKSFLFGQLLKYSKNQLKIDDCQKIVNDILQNFD